MIFEGVTGASSFVPSSGRCVIVGWKSVQKGSSACGEAIWLITSCPATLSMMPQWIPSSVWNRQYFMGFAVKCLRRKIGKW